MPGPKKAENDGEEMELCLSRMKTIAEHHSAHVFLGACGYYLARVWTIHDDRPGFMKRMGQTYDLVVKAKGL